MEPPLLLKLTEGSGPVNIAANHFVSEEADDEDDESDMDEEEMEAVSKIRFNHFSKLSLGSRSR